MYKVHDVEQGSYEWHVLRCGILTASDMHKICKKNAKGGYYATRDDLLMQKVAEAITGEIEPVFQTPEMVRGHTLEPVVRDIYAQKNNLEVDQWGFSTREFDFGTIGYSPDGVVGDDGLLEIKTLKPRLQVKLLVNGDINDEHLWQCQTGMLVTGRLWCDYECYCPNLKIYSDRIARDDDMISTILTESELFYDEMKAIIEKVRDA